MAHLSSQQAMKLAADFAITADVMRADDDSNFERLACLYEKASRVAFLRAHVLSKNEEVCPRFGEGFSRAVFAVA